MTTRIAGLENYSYLTCAGEAAGPRQKKEELAPAEDRLLQHEEERASCCCGIENFARSLLSFFSSLFKNLYALVCGKNSDVYCKAKADAQRAELIRAYPALEAGSWQALLTEISSRPQEYNFATLGLLESGEGTLSRKDSPRRAVHRHILLKATELFENKAETLRYAYWGKSGLAHALFELISIANLGHTHLSITIVGSSNEEFALFKGIMKEFAAEKNLLVDFNCAPTVQDYNGVADLISVPETDDPQEAIPLQERLSENGRLVVGHEEGIGLIDRERPLSQTNYKGLSFGLYGVIAKK